MKAMSTRNDEPTRASRPWDKDRDGFVLGDGAGILVLEEYEHAKARGARIYCELVGFGASSDAYHMTAPSENGDGPARCMAMAMRDAEASIPTRSTTSTRTAPRRRSATWPKRMAIKRAFGDHAYKTMVSSTKSMTGHLLGAAGGVEAIFSIAGAAPPASSRRRSTSTIRAKVAISTTCRTWRARRRSMSPCPMASASAAPTAPWCSSGSEQTLQPGRHATFARTAGRRRPAWRLHRAAIQRAIRCCWRAWPAATRCRAGTCCWLADGDRTAPRCRWRDPTTGWPAAGRGDFLDRARCATGGAVASPRATATDAAVPRRLGAVPGLRTRRRRSSRCCA